MSWRELLRITPGMFLALQHERNDKAKADMMGFRFLATVVAGIVGSDVNYMEDLEATPEQADPEVFEAWLRAKADAAKRTATQSSGTGGDNGAGTSDPDSGKATQRTENGD